MQMKKKNLQLQPTCNKKKVSNATGKNLSCDPYATGRISVASCNPHASGRISVVTITWNWKNFSCDPRATGKKNLSCDPHATRKKKSVTTNL
jgi:hypothetical protein